MDEADTLRGRMQKLAAGHNLKVSVIFTTYNSPEWLQKVLWGFFEQTWRDFEIVIADDGSSEGTRQLIDSMRVQSPVPIVHVWQEDDGFQKCRILNKAILAASGEYLVFTDGDCIPRADFIEKHVQHARPDRFLSGGYYKLPMAISRQITREDVKHQRIFDVGWLRQHGMRRSEKDLKLMATRGWASLLNAISPARASWNGHNASCFKKHILAVNGFEERMQYGGQDREFGDRLVHLGIRGKRIRYSAICVHLDHKRGYVTEEMLANSMRIRQETARTKAVRALKGIDQYIGSGPDSQAA